MQSSSMTTEQLQNLKNKSLTKEAEEEEEA
jgi:hypothetical protein